MILAAIELITAMSSERRRSFGTGEYRGGTRSADPKSANPGGAGEFTASAWAGIYWYSSIPQNVPESVSGVKLIVASFGLVNSMYTLAEPPGAMVPGDTVM